MDSTPVRTTDATTTTLATIAPKSPADGFTVWEVRVLAQATDGSRAGYVRTVGIKQSGGTVSIVGSVGTPITFEDAAGWDCSIDVDANVVRVRVTGAGATTVDWYLQSAGPLLGAGATRHPAIPAGCAWAV